MNENEIKFIQTKNGLTTATEFNTRITYYDEKHWRIGRLHFSYVRVCVFSTVRAYIKYRSYNGFRRALNAFGVKVDLLY